MFNVYLRARVCVCVRVCTCVYDDDVRACVSGAESLCACVVGLLVRVRVFTSCGACVRSEIPRRRRRAETTVVWSALDAPVVEEEEEDDTQPVPPLSVLSSRAFSLSSDRV